MALDREKTFANAERLLKQGKTALALDECKRLAEDAPRDLLMLNRVGDFLARNNRGSEAIVYYEMIATQFTASGFYPKAIAILKKIVKIDPNRLSAVVQLGEINLKQKLPGEARAWLLQAAEEYLRRKEFGKAREVYEKLVAAEPENVVHAVRLAETRAAEGDPTRAGLDLVTLAGRLLTAGRPDEAERTYKRAAELIPKRAEPLVGLARCQASAKKFDEARLLAEQAFQKGEYGESVAADLFLLFELMGDAERSARLLLDPRSDAISAEAIDSAFRSATAAGKVDALWSRVTPLLERWSRMHQFDKCVSLLDRLARTEDGGHLRALEQLVEVRKAEGNRTATARAIERLIRAFQAKGMADKAAAQLDALKSFDPSSPLLFLGRAASPERAAPAPKQAAGPAQESPAVPASAYEAPAVPLTPSDTEFVNGNLTEAEVFEKYGLHREALSQLRQITARFPGHVISQEKLVGFLRTQADRPALRDGLVALAFAKRASGDIDGAKIAVREAASIGNFEPAVRAALEGFALLTDAPKPQVPPKAAAPPAPAKATAKAPPKAPPKAAPVPAAGEDDDDLEIVFDDGGDIPETRGPSESDVLEEIEFYIGQGMLQDAVNRIAQARTAGLDPAALDAFAARVAAAAPAAPAADAGAEAPEELGGDRLDEEELSSITAALTADFGTDRAPNPAAAPPEPESEQSIDEVFAAFKAAVNETVGDGDFQTHYDLGIAYKEMGLLDAAVEEFRVATGTPALYRESCSMLGLCYWERGESDEAIRWYRAALDAPGGEEVRLSGLRYDLADKLEQVGDERGAYDLLAQIQREEPGFRDAGQRLAALRAKLGL